MGKYLDREDWVLVGKSFFACLVIIFIISVTSRFLLNNGDNNVKINIEDISESR
jgi:hypothetical protein